jgi:hypothetical protein
VPPCGVLGHEEEAASRARVAGAGAGHDGAGVASGPDHAGEGHGNRRQPGRLDVLYRQLEWLDWYVRDAKPLDGPLPRLDISDAYLPAK